MERKALKTTHLWNKKAPKALESSAFGAFNHLINSISSHIGGVLMKKKKKVNPNRKPVKSEEINSKDITMRSTRGMVFRAWLDILAAMAGFEGTDQKGMMEFWDNVNGFASTVHRYEDVSDVLSQLEELTGIHLEFKPICMTHKYTQGELKKLERQSKRNARATAFALVIEPIVRGGLFDQEMTKKLLQKAYSYDEDIDSGRLKPEDIQMMLLDEYDVFLESTEDGPMLHIYREDQDPLFNE